MPVVFCCLGYLVLFLALQPVWAMASSMASFLVSEDAPNFSGNLTTVYDPEALKAEADEEGVILAKDIHYPEAGEQYGQIACDRIGLDCPVYWYDTNEILDYGAGTSLASMPPGYGRCIILSGHNMTYFRCFESIQEGDVIKFGTNWCDYEYTVTRVEVYNEKDLESLLASKMNKDEEELVMYTCYPFYAITGRKTDRLTVFATRTVGTDVKWRGVD